jgi:hypothetical protein
VHPDDPVGAHQPFHPLAAHRELRGAQAQLGVHPWRAVGAPRVGVDGADDLDQLEIGSVAGAGGPFAPGVEAAGGHVQDPAGRGDGDAVGGELSDHRVDHFGRTFSRAK